MLRGVFKREINDLDQKQIYIEKEEHLERYKWKYTSLSQFLTNWEIIDLQYYIGFRYKNILIHSF